MSADPLERTIVPLPSLREVKPGSFIYERLHALPDAFCDEVIRRFEEHPEHQRAGVIGQTGLRQDGIKKTTDLVVSDKPEWQDVDQMFFRCMAAALRELWYLNDVPGPGGETEFLYQDVKVRPERGKLVLFPPFWTHEHRAAPVRSGAKYIATTWVVFA
ncbi:MAG: 2OG-Fe(II) oxygenase [Gammaproteobacteria bacterium]|nr:2OG-Fe(II) oxygenase [Gammaproteobacteria bacterium]